jgi:serralysin
MKRYPKPSVQSPVLFSGTGICSAGPEPVLLQGEIMAFTTFKPDFDETMPDVSISGRALLNDITASTIWEDDTIQYGFGTKGVLGLDSEFSQIFHEMFGNAKPDNQFAFANLATRSFTMIDSVAGVDFAFTSEESEVDLVLASTNDKPKSRLEGFFGFPGDMTNDDTFESWSIGAFNSGMKALTARPEAGGGQYGSWTVLHEIGHSLGLKHTHQEVSGLPALDTVGRFMNNERYSVMSYNGASDAIKYGHAVSMMALDVAALQALYGVEDYAQGGSTYSLMNAKGGKLSLAEGEVQIGRAYYCIWDSGGGDTIDYKGNAKSVMINLNDATLDTSGNSDELEALFAQLKGTGFFEVMSKSLKASIFDEWHNAGGFFSQVLDVKKHQFVGSDGGFSIAHGAEIENAMGGKGADLLIGNEQDNSILGGNGDDTILGAAGEERISGDAGSDWIDGGADDDVVWGGSGRDRFVFSDGYGTDTIMDFEQSDIIDLSDLTGFITLEELFDNFTTEQNGDVVIEIGDNILIVKDTSLNDLNANNVFI